MLWKDETDGVQVLVSKVGKFHLAAQSAQVVWGEVGEVGEVGVRRLFRYFAWRWSYGPLE